MINFKYSRLFVLLACLQISVPIYSIWGLDTVKKHCTFNNFKWLDKLIFLPSIAFIAAKDWQLLNATVHSLQKADDAPLCVDEFVRSALRSQGVAEEAIEGIKIKTDDSAATPMHAFFAIEDAGIGYLTVPGRVIEKALSYREDIRKNTSKQQFVWCLRDDDSQNGQNMDRDEFARETEKLLAGFEAVIAHEYSHIKNKDFKTEKIFRPFNIIIGCCLARLLANSCMSANTWKKGLVRGFVEGIFTGHLIKSGLIAFAQRAEYRADYDAVASYHNAVGLRMVSEWWEIFHKNDIAKLTENKFVPHWFIQGLALSPRLRSLYFYLKGDPHMPHLDRALFFEAAADKLEKEQKANEANEIS